MDCFQGVPFGLANAPAEVIWKVGAAIRWHLNSWPAATESYGLDALIVL